LKTRLIAFVAVLSSALTFILVAATPPAQAQTFTDLYNFTGSSDGKNPYGSLVRDAAGNLYGTTAYGGSSNAGTVFKVDKSGAETLLYNFTGGADGGEPYAGLIRDASGNLYGTTYNGGLSGVGTVFKVDASGTETVLHSFATGGQDGCNPGGGLVRDKAGNLYGTTTGCGSSGFGIVFKLNKSGTETVLHAFTGGRDGGAPYAGLARDSSGNLYGTTPFGGSASYGVVFKVNPSGKETVLHSFAGGASDGCSPTATPALDEKGNLYGTADACDPSNWGIIWKVTQKKVETVLHNFAGGETDGGYPYAGVILDANSNLYGTTGEGGGTGCSNGLGCGTVYKLSKARKLTLLHSFTGADGSSPFGAVIRDASGNLYGTALEGGSGGYGTVWQITK
jgi:uncharacterized repeat protein (TIGR03803 family)